MDSTVKRFLFSWMICIVLGLFVGCGTQVRENEPSDIAAIKAMSAARAKAFNERNAGAIAIHFTEDGLLMAPGAPLTSGRNAVERYYQAIFDQYVTGLESGYEDVSVSGDLAYGRGFARVMLIANDGRDTARSTAKYINILRRQPDGSWLTTHDIWNADE